MRTASGLPAKAALADLQARQARIAAKAAADSRLAPEQAADPVPRAVPLGHQVKPEAGRIDLIYQAHSLLNSFNEHTWFRLN